MIRFFNTLIFYFYALNCFAWNMQGHQVIAQIAYDHLTPHAKEMCHKYLNPRSKKNLNANFLTASIWLDLIRFKNIHWYDTFHYIDIPFSNDGSNLPAVRSTNAVWGINHAISILTTKKAKLVDKRLALLILIHLVGDIHQPLHAVTKVSNQLPKGDLGGNLFPLGTNAVGNNLHRYWDKGAGFYTGHSRANHIKNKALLLEEKLSCSLIKIQKNPEQWARDSHHLAVKQVYQIKRKEIPSKRYQLNAQNSIQKQSLIAGCRLAALLNHIAEIG
ncbi:S1/P1 nuclease [Legionella sp.]|uniref:S1/P1 nuclease n=1 Tax=Legionella sp. TaxID=459 RepID=UPI003C875334